MLVIFDRLGNPLSFSACNASANIFLDLQRKAVDAQKKHQATR